MKTLPKWILALAVTGLVIGTFVTVSHDKLPSILELVMPLGVIFTGLFLIVLALQNEAVKFDEDERLKMEAAERHGCSVKGRKHPKRSSVAPAGTKSMNRELPAHQPMEMEGHRL